MPVPMRVSRRVLFIAPILALVLPCAAVAQTQQAATPCPEAERSDKPSHCEIRQLSLPATDMLTVDATPNGGIAVHGGGRADIQVNAKVVANAETAEQARALAGQVKVLADGGRIHAEGPKAPEGSGWSVSFDVMAPSRGAFDLRSVNGGVSVADVDGRVTFKTVNGGIALDNVNGDVHGSTTNGGVRVTLQGHGWVGAGLDVETLNGGVQLRVPDGYSAHLEAATQNGGLQIDFPVTVQGSVGKTLNTDLGNGGAPVRLRTTNGGVSVRRR